MTLRYVVNRHQATTLHYDLRLEVGDTLASWAVPKGPTLDPAVKRLAIRVDDHDLEHLTYEDDHKVVWDTGLYEPATDPSRALDDGHLRFVLAGHRLQGAFALQRTAMGWLLLKLDDEYGAPGQVWADDELGSVVSDRTL